MPATISNNIKKVPDFYVLKIDQIANDLLRQGKDIIKLNLGKSEAEMHETVINAFKEKISDYKISNIVDSRGLPELRNEIVKYYKKKYNVGLSSDKVFINNGTSPLFLATFSVLIDAGDAVLLPKPYYPCYSAVADIVRARKEFYRIRDGKLDIEDFKNKFNHKKTKLVVINSPGNPLGNVLNRAELEQILDIVNGNAFVLSDEIYDGFVYDDFTSILEVYNQDRDKVIFLNGFSKIHHMYTRRVGYVIVPEIMEQALLRYHQHTLVCVDPVPQYAAVISLRNMDSIMKKEIEAEVAEYKKRLQECDNLVSKTKLKLIKPKGSWYFCVNIKEYLKGDVKDSLDLAELLIKKANVAVAPGIDFGDDNIFRISLTSSRVVEGVKQICEFLKGM